MNQLVVDICGHFGNSSTDRSEAGSAIHSFLNLLLHIQHRTTTISTTIRRKRVPIIKIKWDSSDVSDGTTDDMSDGMADDITDSMIESIDVFRTVLSSVCDQSIRIFE